MRALIILCCAAVASAAAVSSEMHPAAFNEAHVVDGSKCTVLKQSQVGPAGTYCCEACHHPYLMQTNELSLSVVTTDRFLAANRAAAVVSDGSGDLSPDDSAGVVKVASKAFMETVAVSVLKESTTLTVPCGECISLDECMSRGSHVELWHHQCVA